MNSATANSVTVNDGLSCETVHKVRDQLTRTSDFSDLVDQFGPALSRVAAAFEANSALQEELLQEILLAIWQALPAHRSDSPLRNYIFRIAHNRAVSHVARYAGKPGITSFDEQQHVHSSQAIGSPEQQMSQEQRSDLLLSAIRTLPVAQKQLVALSMEGFSYIEISEISGFSVSNVGARLTRAREALKRLMEESIKLNRPKNGNQGAYRNE